MQESNFSVIHTEDPKMKKLLEVAENVASSKASVLIAGESGTGKELLARYIHAKSNRATKPFVAVNCAALPDGLLESELFGYEKGAFTGANQRKIGKFEIAHGATFLLDEISEMPLVLQAKLLRVLQEGEVERLGGVGPVHVNVRVIATTNRNMLSMVREGQFREDLYYRLNVIPLEVPSLRTRPRDIDYLSQLFVELCCVENGVPTKYLSADSLVKLKGFQWPGNVRELRNVIERSVLLCPQTQIDKDHILVSSPPRIPPEASGLNAGMTVAEVERLLILKTLDHTAQNRTKAAKLLGISIRTLRNKINEYRGVGVL